MSVISFIDFLEFNKKDISSSNIMLRDSVCPFPMVLVDVQQVWGNYSRRAACARPKEFMWLDIC
ncbi:hypothetical protein E2C01_050397 [Portunus trituberculatus]|uniref:Uncharacterized protein n=1 Tax=Portunus trituberculatus TaxID=210409 RepID=A0A5B7GFU1_PORTR|nr:hypothetical protein [Portunus trituberculatus]